MGVFPKSFKKSFKKSYTKKKSYNKKSSRPLVSMAVKKFVNRTVHANIENKIFTYYAINQPITVPQGGATGVTAVVLVPAISQGVGQAGRIGNNCKVLSAKLDLIINLKDYAVITSTLKYPVYVRCILLKYRPSNVLAAFSDLSLFQTGNTTVGCQGNLLDIMFKVNREVYTIYSDKTFLLSSTINSSIAAVGQYSDQMSGFSRRLKFDCSKYIKHLKYDDNSTAVTNTNLYLVMIPTSADGTSLGSVGVPIEYHFNYEIQYEDA